MGEQLLNPPLIEALVEFHFSSDTPWDSTIPGLLYQGIRKQFKKAPRRRNFQIAIEESKKGARLVPEDWSVFEHKQENVLVQVGPRLIAVNNPKPYIGWEKLSEILHGIVGSIHESIEDGRLETVNIRYINRIEITHNTTDLTTLFTLFPFIESEKYSEFNGFIVGMRFAQDYGTVLTELQSVDSDTLPTFLLSISYGLKELSLNNADDIHKKLTQAHDVIEELFNDIVRLPVRESFNILSEER